MATYLADLQTKKLNEIVIPGSHDTGIYVNNLGGNTKTQAFNFKQQAQAGCRFFDMRIATHKTNINGVKKYEHAAYHADKAGVGNYKIWKKNKNKQGGHLGKYQKLAIGGWGDSLTNMLSQARTYVESNPSEFLILKFSKCYNWSDIAFTCLEELGDVHYSKGGNLNTKKVSELAGTVITVFDEPARAHLGDYPRLCPQIMFIDSLYNSETKRSKGYNQNYAGMQYFGKYSNTKWSPAKPHKNLTMNQKIKTNSKKQGKQMGDNAYCDVDALGMMYWTSTGLFENIQSRNSQMWSKTNIKALQDTWESGLQDAIDFRLQTEHLNVKQLKHTPGGGALGGRIKAFMPNIVMMDFVDTNKCNVVKGLNDVAGSALAQLYIKCWLDEEDEDEQ